MTVVVDKNERQVKRNLRRKYERKLRDRKLAMGFVPSLNPDVNKRQAAGLSPAQMKSGARRVA